LRRKRITITATRAYHKLPEANAPSDQLDRVTKEVTSSGSTTTPMVVGPIEQGKPRGRPAAEDLERAGRQSWQSAVTVDRAALSVGIKINYLCPLLIGGDFEDDEVWQRLDAGLVDYVRQLGLTVAKWRRPTSCVSCVTAGTSSLACRKLDQCSGQQWRLKFAADQLLSTSDAGNGADEDESGRLVINPHLKAKPQPDTAPWVTRLVQGDYAYYHYGSCGFHDSGWGCAYSPERASGEVRWLVLGSALTPRSETARQAAQQRRLVRLKIRLRF
uniref:Radical SAM protein n=1 Tax=Macrostomum lignano TaxID=282301 RepID=A0A1I8F850_9PLAT